MVEKIRHQLFLPKPLSDRLEALAAAPGASKSAILADAVAAWLDRRDASELDARFGPRLDRLAHTLDRIESDGHALMETLALLVRYQLSVTTPLAEDDAAGRAAAARRFDAFVQQVVRQIASGRRTIGIAHPGGER